jgi:hypothetical protein
LDLAKASSARPEAVFARSDARKMRLMPAAFPLESATAAAPGALMHKI